MRKFYLETFGCQMNVHDSERMAGLLERAGFEPADSADHADVVVLNTCSGRERAEDKLFSRLGELRAAPPGRQGRPVIAVAGCVAQQEGPAILKRAPHVNVVVGTRAQRELPDLLSQAIEERTARVETRALDDVSFPIGVARRGDPVKAYVTIIEGCNDACAFCVVPHTRGPERMRPMAEILDEVRAAAASGHREVQLLGQIVNDYQAPDRPGAGLADLLAAVNDVAGIERIRFASPHPRHVDDRLVDAVRALPRVCKHIHLPVQSGSTRILAAMRRRHTREDYLGLLNRIRDRVPEVSLSTDIIVGFPGETDEDFEQTVDAVKRFSFDAVFVAKYSDRPGTPATGMQNKVPQAVVDHRHARLLDVVENLSLLAHQNTVGRTEEVLVLSPHGEEQWFGRTRSGKNVWFTAASPTSQGQFCSVAIERASREGLYGARIA